MPELVDFSWCRCREKYKLTNDNTSIAAAGTLFESYRPLEVEALYARFADSKATPAGMLDFCNKFGLPGGVRPEPAVPTGYQMIRWTAVDVLLFHHGTMRAALRQFEAGNPTKLVEYFNGHGGLWSVHTILQRGPNNQVKMVFNPPDLIRAMWMQFALHACLNVRILRCQRCSAPIPVGTGTDRRSTAKFCSNACKVAAFKERQAAR
jgi:hypothetical protein